MDTPTATATPARLIALALAACVLASCAPEPLLDPDAQTPPLALVPVAYAGIADGRGRFREILCRLEQHHGTELPDHRPCEQILHELPGEGVARGWRVNFSTSSSGLRLLIVPGLAAACLGEAARPLHLAARHVETFGFEVAWAEVDGLASSAQNADAIRAAIRDLPAAPGRPLVVLGYGKGTSDLLEALADPEVARRVTAVVSLGGSVNGSPLADHPAETAADLLARLAGTDCAGGDPDARASLRRGRRIDWLATRRLPPAIRYYSLASFTVREHVSSPLRAAYDDLALIDPRNDGQLLFYDQVLPASTLLGYLDADHWAIALPLARDHPQLADRVDHNAFPRELLLEAILRYVEDDLGGFPRERSGDAPVLTARAGGA